MSVTPYFDLEFELEDDIENSNEGHFRVQRPKADLGTKFEGNLNPSLNPSLNASVLHGRCHERLFCRYCRGGAVLPSILVGICSV